jgi:AraC-like DNA-binding protein
MSSEFSMLDCYGGVESVNAHLKNEHFSKHVHEGYAIGVINSGLQKFDYRGANHFSGTNSLVILNSDTVHTGESGCEAGWSYRALYPTPEFINSLFLDTPNFGDCAPSFHQPVIKDQALVEHLRLLFHYADHQAPKLVLESLLFTFFTRLFRYLGDSRLNQSLKKASPNIIHARDYLKEHVDLNVSLDELAQVAGLNKYTLIRHFKEKWGLAPHQYQIQLKLHQAKARLRQGERPVDVASQCGFFDQSHFSAHFKRALGATPNAYRACMYSAGNHD